MTRTFIRFHNPRRWYFRVAGYGPGLLNHGEHPALYGERHNQSGSGKHYLHLGPWCLRWFTPRSLNDYQPVTRRLFMWLWMRGY